MKVIAIVLAGGSGLRFGGSIPKQFVRVRGKMIIEYCLEVICASSKVDGIWIVCDEKYRKMINKIKTEKFMGFSDPGENRQLSVYNALKDMEKEVHDEDTCVLVHDAARPMLSLNLIKKCVEMTEGHDGAMPVLPMTDTVYVSEDGMHVKALLNRREIFAGQAPEIFNYMKYKAAIEKLSHDEIIHIHGSSEPAIMAGMDIAIFPGDKKNIKITTADDIRAFEQMI